MGSLVYAIDGGIIDVVIIMSEGPQPHVLKENGCFITGGGEAEADLRKLVEVPIIIGEVTTDQHSI
jgi:hypothetical protein